MLYFSRLRFTLIYSVGLSSKCSKVSQTEHLHTNIHHFVLPSRKTSHISVCHMLMPYLIFIFFFSRGWSKAYVYVKALLKWPQTKFLHKVLVVGLYEKYKVQKKPGLIRDAFKNFPYVRGGYDGIIFYMFSASHQNAFKATLSIFRHFY